MLHFKKFLLFSLCAIFFFGDSSAKAPKIVSMELVCNARPFTRFSDLEKGLSLYVTSDAQNSEILDLSQVSKKDLKKIKDVQFVFTPSITQFVEESLNSFIRYQNIPLSRDRRTDYILKVNVKEFKFIDGNPSSSKAKAVVSLEYSLLNESNNVVMRQISTGRSSFASTIPATLDNAFSKAIQDIDWNGIASYLKGIEEKDKKVTGNGDTELEHCVIRWLIDSRPAGADVTWRIVSSTPDVKSSNSTYIGTTPYESTESFDIKGLRKSNAGNVQIEVKCEKPGYLPQTRRFNLLQAIDQKEISAKFNLVREEE
ncbi:MAG: hypothetical protein J1E84_06240 [Muribaculaceae bacterium]|nr:hypothetical protein [Muribaculaceae bacterium]